MKRKLSSLSSCIARKAIAATLAGAALTAGVIAVPKAAKAQEIQLTGPLAGAPAVRRLRLYRQGRIEAAIGPSFTLLDEYQRTIFVAGHIQYNIFDFLAIGVFGGFGALSLNTDLTDKIDANAPRNSRTAVNLPPKSGQPNGQAFEKQTGKLKYMFGPQLQFSPFRGKLAVFQKLFVDTDLYIHGGLAFVGVAERLDCGAPGQKPCTISGNADAFKTQTRAALAPTFGLGISLYPSGFVGVKIEYRAIPFSWNRGGFDSRGGAPDASFPDTQISGEDRTFKFNQMITIAAGFHFPAAPKISD